MLVGCSMTDSIRGSEDYVEVSGLRIDQAEIFMSPSGTYSTYQLDIQILPANATNRKLSYYIPSEYLYYVSVSDTGLLTAHEETEAGVVIPLTVTSTTNEKAKISLSVTVEEIPITKISFAQEKLSFWYEGEPQEASVSFYPVHAIDGRSAKYTSLDESVATVAEDRETGNCIVTPVGVGQTHIKAVATTTDKAEYEAFLPVYVDYMPAQYQLHVSGNPQWTQIIGEFTPINFTLYVLGDHIDPDPEIEWYVGSERVLGQSDLRQYSHLPEATTQLTYQVRVFVRGYKQEGMWLTSDDIVIYNDFTGFELNYQNLSAAYAPYQYGDTATFELLEASSGNTASYDWYLQKMDGDGQELLVATTPVDNRNLTRRLNVVGDYQLVARAKSFDDTDLKQTRFTFNAERLVVGDTLVVKPELLAGGLPPDSYHWYLLECDEEGRYDIADKKELFSTSQTETFYYQPEKAGFYRLLVTSSTGGVLTTIRTGDGNKREQYQYVGKVLRVYESGAMLEEKAGSTDLVDFSDPEAYRFEVSTASRVSDVVIEGCYYLGENLLYVHWTPCYGVDRYIVELTFEDGTVRILDSADKEAVFGPNYLYIPQEIADFDSKFSLRIKQKDGVFSDLWYYGIPNVQGAGDEHHVLKLSEDLYPYFANIANNINGYVTTTDELNALVDYILLYQPTQNSYVRKGNTTIGGVLFDTFSVNFYTTLTYTSDMMNAYSVDVPESVPNDLYDVYTMILGAHQQGPHIIDFDLALEKGNSEGAYTATFILANKKTRFLATPDRNRNDAVTSAFSAEKPYGKIDMVYPVDRKDGVYVTTSDQLCYVFEQGYRPVPTGDDDLAELYKQIKSVYSSLVGKKTSDLEKVLAFYDWLCYSVTYDRAAEELAFSQTQIENYRYESHHLEGIFAKKNQDNRHATPAGYAKAFAALCGLAGIPCRTVSAKVGSLRVYNKVYVLDSWYVIDVGFGVAQKDDGTVYADHTWFLMSDAEYSSRCLALGYRADTYGLHPAAEKKFYFYTGCSLDGNSLYITSQDALEALIKAVKQSGRVAVELECSSRFCSSFSVLRTIVMSIVPGGGKFVEDVIDVTEEGGDVRAIVILYENS